MFRTRGDGCVGTMKHIKSAMIYDKILTFHCPGYSNSDSVISWFTTRSLEQIVVFDVSIIDGIHLNP